MKKSIYSLLILALVSSCNNPSESNKDTESTENEDTLAVEQLEIELEDVMPNTKMLNDIDNILSESTGDLDKDGIAEKVVVYDTDRMTDWGTERELHIYKQSAGNWEPWIISNTAILKSEEGGMMGDPFRYVEIDNGILSINHDGGSSWKWGHTYKYRFQDEGFYLIGFTSFYGKLCEFWEDADYNLSTGDVKFSIETENCDDNDELKATNTEKDSFNHLLDKLPNLETIILGDIVISTPVLKKEFRL